MPITNSNYGAVPGPARAEDDEETQQRMCAILYEAAKKLSKGKFKKALKKGKNWARSLNDMCDDLGVT